MLEGQKLRRAGAHREATSAFNAAEKILRPLARRGVTETAWVLAWCRLWRAHADYSRGAFAEALQRYGDVLPVMSACGDDRGLVAVFRGLGNVSKYLGLYADAAEHYERSVQHAKASRDHIGRAMAEHNLGNVMLALEDFPGAEAAYRRAAVGFARTKRRDLLQHAWVNLAEVARAAGDSREALRRLARAEQISRESRINAGFEAERLIALGTCQRELGRPSAARAAFDRAVELATGARELHIAALAHRALAEMLLASGSVDEARTTTLAALKLCAASGISTELCGDLHEMTALAARRLADWPMAALHFEQALQERKRLSAHLAKVGAKTITLTHDLNRVRYDAELARMENTRLEEALARVATRLHALESDEPAISIEEVTPESLAPLGLSPRECEVLLWVARGKTNAEIAIIVGCGGETIKTHLKRISKRLNVTNRAALASRAAGFVSSSFGGGRR
ncbi:MAG TPA: tetratricopeptide repeat protein [Opitutaceae bacterium]|nr:tetratricopeptide repeat protein [Opitutaceae bacterium]